MSSRITVALFAILFCFIVPQSSADTLSFDADRNNTLYEDAQGDVSNGAGEYFFAGVTAMGELRRGLVRFDVSAIPAGSTINSATLTLNMSRNIAGPHQVTLQRVADDWGAAGSDATGEEGSGAPSQTGDATWIHRFFDTSVWLNVGGDFFITISATQNVDAVGPYTWGSTPEMVADVQLWIDDPMQNFGWILRSDEFVTPSTKRFDTLNNSDPAVRPMLTVDFTPAGLPAPEIPTLAGWGLALLAMIVMLVGARRLRAQRL